MGTRRLLRLLLGAAALVAAGAAAPGAGATTIVFSSGDGSNSILISSGSGDEDSQGIQVNLTASMSPLPQKLVVQVPAGYSLDLSAPAGTAVADARLFISGVDSPSFAIGSGPLVARDPGAYASDPAAQACAAGLHAAVWSMTTPIVGQAVTVTFFVDGSRAAGYTLQSCPSGLPTGTSETVTTISVGGLDGLVSPTAAGNYVWHALVTPQGAQAYELQALVPLPETVTLRGRFDAKARKAVLTGRVVEGGKPVAGVRIFLGSSDNDFFGLDATTRIDGTFTLRLALAKTTDFGVSVAPTVGPCDGAPAAPGGCLGSLTVPPDSASATVWVSVRGGAVRATRAADQRLAERELLAAADLPTGFSTTGGAGHACENQTHESDLTITGEAASPGFVRFGEGDVPSIVQTAGLARVYATAKQARAAFDREAVLTTARCVLEVPDTKQPKIRAFRLAGLPARVRGFRASFAAGPGFKVDLDIVFLQRGRSVQRLLFAIAGTTHDLEHKLAAKVAGRMR